jgi:hypothetical protein
MQIIKKKLLTNGPKFILILLWHHGLFSFRKVVDSIPDEVIGYLNLPNSSSRMRPWGRLSV